MMRTANHTQYILYLMGYIAAFVVLEDYLDVPFKL